MTPLAAAKIIVANPLNRDEKKRSIALDPVRCTGLDSVLAMKTKCSKLLHVTVKSDRSIKSCVAGS
jgi:hypothetical protein